MPKNAPGGALRAAVCALVLACWASAAVRPAHAAANYPDIPVWANAGTWQDSSLVSRNRCVVRTTVVGACAQPSRPIGSSPGTSGKYVSSRPG